MQRPGSVIGGDGLRADSGGLTATLTPSESIRQRLQSLLDDPKTPAGAVVKASEMLIKLDSQADSAPKRPATLELMDFLALHKPSRI